jgi:hypothetical protein
MVDLAAVLQRYYFSPLTGGANSIKRVLPAILHDCPSVAAKYSAPGRYGLGKEFHSRNFVDHVWVQPSCEYDPYRTLDTVLTTPTDHRDQHSNEGHLHHAPTPGTRDDSAREERRNKNRDSKSEGESVAPSIPVTSPNPVHVAAVVNGTAAVIAYNRLMLRPPPPGAGPTSSPTSSPTEAERRALSLSLLRYCELDTLAMAMVLQGLLSLGDRRSL